MSTSTRPTPPLQKGAVLLPQVQRVQKGNWSPLNVDASLDLYGVTWLRVHGGFGGRFDREDWIADLPGVSVSVCDYHWNGEDFGPNHGTFENACREELKKGLRLAREMKAEAEDNAAKLGETVARLEGLSL